MRIICISGKAQHGKDQSAKFIKDILNTKYNKKVLIIHNADLLKYMCKSIFEWDGNKDEKGRTLLQYVGTDVIRKQDHDFWVRFISNVVNLFPNEWDYVLVPDCRFPNEIEYLKENTNCEVIHLRVKRPNFDNGLTVEQQSHPSETALDNTEPDYTLINGSTLNELYFRLLAFMNLIEV